jgi:hypothetical protein
MAGTSGIDFNLGKYSIGDFWKRARSSAIAGVQQATGLPGFYRIGIPDPEGFEWCHLAIELLLRLDGPEPR